VLTPADYANHIWDMSQSGAFLRGGLASLGSRALRVSRCAHDGASLSSRHPAFPPRIWFCRRWFGLGGNGSEEGLHEYQETRDYNLATPTTPEFQVARRGTVSFREFRIRGGRTPYMAVF